MARLGLERAVVDTAVYENTINRFKEAGVLLPTIGQLRDPSTIPVAIREKLKDVSPDSPHPLNLFRVHWFNDAARTGLTEVPEHIELPSELTGVRARIVLALAFGQEPQITLFLRFEFCHFLRIAFAVTADLV